MDNKPKTTIRTRRETRSETKVEQLTVVGGSVEGVIDVDKETIDLPRKRTRRGNIEMPSVQTRRNNTNRKVEMQENSNTSTVVKPAVDPQMTTKKDNWKGFWIN